MAKNKKDKNKSRPRAESGGLVFEGLNDCWNISAAGKSAAVSA